MLILRRVGQILFGGGVKVPVKSESNGSSTVTPNMLYTKWKGPLEVVVRGVCGGNVLMTEESYFYEYVLAVVRLNASWDSMFDPKELPWRFVSFNPRTKKLVVDRV